jgi:hypothetical protein
MMRRLEFMLQVLTGQGASIADAMTYAALIDRHIAGSGRQEAEEAEMNRRYGLDDEASLQAALAAVRDLAAAGGRYRAWPNGPPARSARLPASSSSWDSGSCWTASPPG